MKILHEDCDPKLAQDKKLPYTAYLVCYEKDNTGTLHHDLTVAGTQVEIFDHYYDKYKSVLAIVQSEGRVTPKLWNDPNKKPEKKKKK